ncbi:MAG: phosphatase PAP2 family protein [Burkholderiaceae bacterium]
MRSICNSVISVLTLVVCASSVSLFAQASIDQRPVSATVSAAEPLFSVAAPVSTWDFDQVVQKPAGPPPTPRHTGIIAMVKGLGSDVKHLPSRQNLFILSIGGGLALIAHPFDDDVNRRLTNNHSAERFFKPGAVMGELGTLLGGAATVYAVGRLKDEPKVSHLGMDLIRSLAISEGVTQTLKYTTRRERPDHSSRNSFPSGHAADTFAFATALERHLGWRGAAPAYVFASYVALSRMPANRHWLSDAVFGAAVGVVAGRTVTRHGREYPVALTVVPGGAAVVYVRRNK